MTKKVRGSNGVVRDVGDAYVLLAGETFVASAVPANVSGAAHTYRTTPVGDGSLYGWKEMSADGAVVRVSTQSWPSEADAEKAIRTIAPESDIVEVLAVNNINKEANRNVNVVQKVAPITEAYGVNPVSHSIDELLPEDVKAEIPHQNVAKMVEIDAVQAPLVAKAQAVKDEADRAAAFTDATFTANRTAETARRAALTPEQRAAEDKVAAEKAAADAKTAAEKKIADDKEAAVKVAQAKLDAAKIQLDAANAITATPVVATA